MTYTAQCTTLQTLSCPPTWDKLYQFMGLVLAGTTSSHWE